MKSPVILLPLLIAFFSPGLRAQEIKPYDLSRPYTNVSLEGTRIDLFDGEIYQWSFNGRLSFFKGRHQFGINVPFMRTDYITNIERRTGIGDVKCHYMIQLMSDTLSYTKKAFSFYLDYNFPTGERESGHGLGASVLSPALVLMLRPIDELSTFVGVRYAHSLSAADGSWNSPPQYPYQDPILEPKMRDLIIDLAAVLDFGEDAWLKINFNFVSFLDEDDMVLNLEPEIGKIWRQKWSLAANSRIFIGGRKRVNSIIGFNFAHFIW